MQNLGHRRQVLFVSIGVALVVLIFLSTWGFVNLLN
jgi:hypothetical protein